ncbi:hypothetical protein DF121_27220 [Burkholderia stagnalis]|nr:hypothetical protein DF145_26885 [Burkholderia stagnalis]RQX92514.1 hypothetical protein DF121_27220 [Burkholderia stagnalis]RQY18432.1 hypothetical protein DF115_12985 [Burkholderia stagnalis]RQY26594.1 hypothetical protein DF114_26715 [Burkholderia stagnalis]
MAENAPAWCIPAGSHGRAGCSPSIRPLSRARAATRFRCRRAGAPARCDSARRGRRPEINPCPKFPDSRYSHIPRNTIQPDFNPR